MHDPQRPLTPAGLASSFQYQALARVLQISRLCATAPRDEVPAALAAGLDALNEALAHYDAWTRPGTGH